MPGWLRATERGSEMFTLNTAYGQAIINGLGQVLLFASEEGALAYIADNADLQGKVRPVLVHQPEVAVVA